MRITTLVFFSLISISCIAQKLGNEELSKSLHYQVSVGIATTNFNYPKPGSLDKPLLFVHSDIFLVKNITPRLDGRIGVAFEPVGFTYTYNLGNTQSSIVKHRLYYSNLHFMTAYRLNKSIKNIDIRLLTGVFVGRLLDHDIVSLLRPDNKTFKSKAISTYRLWNGGVSLGLSGSLTVRKNNAVGLKLIVSPGLTNIYIPEATKVTGFKRFTRSIDLSTFFSF